MERETIKNILESAINAPSGSNSQPWRFEVRNGIVRVVSLPERDHPILNFRNRGTLLAHGALIENIIIAAPSFGYRADIALFPEKDNQAITADISFIKENSDDALFSALSERTTNRKPYATESLPQSESMKLLQSVRGMAGGAVYHIDAPEKIKNVGAAAAVNEIVMLENRKLHELFFNEIVWSAGEERDKRSGLFIDTMELAVPQRFALRLIRRWPVMNFLNALGFARQIARDNGKTYAAAPLMGAVAVPDTDAAFIDAGRILERLWLSAAASGLQFHLITGVPFLYQRIRSGGGEIFSERHARLIEDAYKRIGDAFGIKEGIIAGIFRVGHGEPPTARSAKRPPDIVFAE